MPVVADLIAYLDPLVAETSSGATPDLVEGPAPEQPDDLVAITHYLSERSDDYVMAPSLTAPGSELERVQVMARSVSMATAITRANAFHVLLDNLLNVTMSGRVYFSIESEGPPFSLGQDQSNRWRFVANYVVRKHRG